MRYIFTVFINLKKWLSIFVSVFLRIAIGKYVFLLLVITIAFLALPPDVVLLSRQDLLLVLVFKQIQYYYYWYLSRCNFVIGFLDSATRCSLIVETGQGDKGGRRQS